MRIPGLGGEVMRRVGANAVLIPAQEIFPALQSGAIDATELQGPWLDTVSGFHRHAKYYYAPGWQETNGIGEIGLNADVFDSLTPQQQNAVRRSCEAANAVNIGEWQFHNARFLRTLKTEHGVNVRTYPDDVIDALARAAAEVVAEVGAVDERGKEIYASWSDVFRKSLEYSVVAEVPFYKARERQLAML